MLLTGVRGGTNTPPHLHPPVCLTEQSTSILTNSIISRQTARNAAIKRISSDGASFTRLIKSRRTTVGCQGLETSLSWVFITERTKTGFRRRNAVVWPACHMSWLRECDRKISAQRGGSFTCYKTSYSVMFRAKY